MHFPSLSGSYDPTLYLLTDLLLDDPISLDFESLKDKLSLDYDSLGDPLAAAEVLEEGIAPSLKQSNPRILQFASIPSDRKSLEIVDVEPLANRVSPLSQTEKGSGLLSNGTPLQFVPSQPVPPFTPSHVLVDLTASSSFSPSSSDSSDISASPECSSSKRRRMTGSNRQSQGTNRKKESLSAEQSAKNEERKRRNRESAQASRDRKNAELLSLKEERNLLLQEREQYRLERKRLLSSTTEVEAAANLYRKIFPWTSLKPQIPSQETPQDQDIKSFQRRIPQVMETIVLEMIATKEDSETECSQLLNRIKALEQENQKLKQIITICQPFVSQCSPSSSSTET